MSESSAPSKQETRICHKCGYDLRGLDHDNCPECGTVWQPGSKPRLRRRDWVIAAVIAVVASYVPYGWIPLFFGTGDLTAWAFFAITPGAWIALAGGLDHVVFHCLSTLVCLAAATLPLVRFPSRRLIIVTGIVPAHMVGSTLFGFMQFGV